jgi:hypothetical protein
MDAAARSSSDRLITVIAPDTARPAGAGRQVPDRPAGVGHRVPDRQGAIGPRCLPGRVRNLDAARTAPGRPQVIWSQRHGLLHPSGDE